MFFLWIFLENPTQERISEYSWTTLSILKPWVLLKRPYITTPRPEGDVRPWFPQSHKSTESFKFEYLGLIYPLKDFLHATDAIDRPFDYQILILRNGFTLSDGLY